MAQRDWGSIAGDQTAVGEFDSPTAV